MYIRNRLRTKHAFVFDFEQRLSNVLAKEMPVLQQPGIWPAIVDAVSAAFRDGESVDVAIADRYRPERPAGQ
ncbi:hypothetical protein DIE03_17570 [Burkholderia sp. Bp8992]|nr:hypothetical protein DIE03_17570 [Burkholderia sp. Bp8992]